jgi:hypothetical protein
MSEDQIKKCHISEFLRAVTVKKLLDGKQRYIFTNETKIAWNDDCRNQLCNLIIMCLKKLKLYYQSPALIGYPACSTWHEDSDTLREFCAEVFEKCLAKRVNSLCKQLETKPDVTGYIVKNIKNRLNEKQAEIDPIGSSVFFIVWGASEDAKKRRKLKIQLKGSKFSDKSVLILKSDPKKNGFIIKQDILYLFSKQDISFFDDFNNPIRTDDESSKKVLNARKKLVKLLEELANTGKYINVKDILECLKNKIMQDVVKFNFECGGEVLNSRPGGGVFDVEKGDRVRTTSDQFIKNNAVTKQETLDKLKKAVQYKINNHPKWRSETKKNALVIFSMWCNLNEDLVIEGIKAYKLKLDSIRKKTKLGRTQALDMRKTIIAMLKDSIKSPDFQQ